MNELTCLFEKEYGMKPEIKRLTGGGSPRQYYRLSANGVSVVGVYSEETKDNENFIRLATQMSKGGINVPKVISASEDNATYLLEDLGDTLLLSILDNDNKMELAQKALDELVKIQTLPEEFGLDHVGYKPFSERLVMWDLNYFKYDFLKPSSIIFDEEKLEDDFSLLKTKLLDKGNLTGFMYRDYQSRNIMVKDGKFGFIDFQGARKGPLVYDAVSFIWQAKAPFSFEEREELCRYYAKKLSNQLGVSVSLVESQMETMEVFRTLQVVGAYGFRGLIEQKRHFIESIPRAITNLKYLKQKGLLDDYPEIARITAEMDGKKYEKGESEGEGLTLKVYSFSYKKGYPEDRSGNGGGFMFDCRGIHNPGRYDKYKSLTGLDREVADFLIKDGEAEKFVDNALKVVKPSIERYIKRGFDSLQVGFGCTGGQHRSVFCANEFGKRVRKQFPQIKIKLIHREQELKEEI